MNLITPDLGLIFWQTIILLVVLWILKKYAWKPILHTLQQRENAVETALKSAEKARKETAQLHANNKKLIEEVRQERDKIIKEAKDAEKTIIEEAKGEAEKVTTEMIEKARVTIQNEKENAIITLKNQVGLFAIQIAEQLLKRELTTKKAQEAFVRNVVKKMKLK
ncbi:MAG: F0F1 ATP synthase subunit B [Cytophagales bacterium]|nr:F0F1 ATP synthase subunit B [Cytophagales bacterium]